MTDLSLSVIEAGAEALFKQSDFEGSYAALTEMSKEIYREKAAAVYRAGRAADPDWVEMRQRLENAGRQNPESALTEYDRGWFAAVAYIAGPARTANETVHE